MNIKFKSIDIENFRSIDKAKINLESQGIVIVKGINEYEDKATSNGSGKSSIFEAIIYSLFEETSSGEKNVANRIIGNGFKLILRFQVDGIEYMVVRESTDKGKSSVILYKDSIDISARNKTDTNKLILNILGINKSIFLDSIFLSQNISTNLASLSPTARKERLEILTSTDTIVNNFKEKLKNKQLEYEAKSVEYQMNINKLNGKKESLENQKRELENKLIEIDNQLKARNALGDIETIDKEIETNKKNIEIQTYDLNEKEKEIELKEKEIIEFRDTGKENQDKKDLMNKELNDKREECNQLSNDITSNEMKLSMYKEEITRLEKEKKKILESDTCPTCGRKYDNINEEHIKNTIKEIDDNIHQENQKIENTAKEIKEIEEILNEKINDGKLFKQQVEEIEKDVAKFNNRLNELENERSVLTESRKRINNNIQILQNTIISYTNKKQEILNFKVEDKEGYQDMLQKLLEDVNNIDKDLSSQNVLLNDINNYIMIVKHCLQLVTKEFRSYLLQNSITYLNKVLQEYSNQLFSNLSDTIYISNDDSKLDIMLGNAPYESLSGGEKTRVNIALLLAQKSLASTIGNISCNIIILDEILGYCDSQAELNIIDLIIKELESLESIFMVSHKEIPIGYDSQLIVVKDRNGLSNIKTG